MREGGGGGPGGVRAGGAEGAEDGEEDGDLGVGREGGAEVGHLEQDEARGPGVDGVQRRGVGRVAQHHLGGAVPGRDDAGREGVAGRGGGAGGAEVGELGDGAVAVEEDVVGLDVPGSTRGMYG